MPSRWSRVKLTPGERYGSTLTYNADQRQVDLMLSNLPLSGLTRGVLSDLIHIVIDVLTTHVPTRIRFQRI